ncbi:MAG: RidA family protein, partial [Lysobacter sp.]
MSDPICSASAPKPVGNYPHARRVGNVLYLSGIGPRDPSSNAIIGDVHDVDGYLISYDIEAQCRAAFANIRTVLKDSGARWEDLVDVTAYLTNMPHDFSAYNAAWAEAFPDINKAPCR